MRSLLLSICLLFSPLALALGEISASSAKPSNSAIASYQEPFSAEALTQLLLGLLFVIALIFVLSWFFRRFSGISPLTKNMKVLGVLPLSTREKAVLVQVGDKQILIGVAPGRVSHLHSFEEKVVEEQAQDSFASRLGEAIAKRRGENEAD